MAIPSEIISLNHKDIDDITNIKDNISIIYALLKLCIDNAVLVAKFNKLTLVYNEVIINTFTKVSNNYISIHKSLSFD